MPTVFRKDGSINSAQGPALQGVIVYVCTQPAVTNVIPPSPLATIYSDNAGANPINQATAPLQSDGLGNWFFYAATGVYTIVLFDPIGRIPTTIFLDQQVVSPGGGSVTSIALTMPAEFAVAGSPISSSGTFAVTKSNESANTVAAGPTSGGAAAWAFRALVAADLPAGTGTVTSVQLGIAASLLFTASISGTNPITTSGTFTLNLGLANQNANSFLAGPASGGSGATASRLMVAADIFGITTVAFSATPVFDASTFPIPLFKITLTGTVTSSSVINATNGQQITFEITQDGTGGHPFAWPPDFKDPSPIAPDATLVSIQTFVRDGSFWRPTGPGITMAP